MTDPVLHKLRERVKELTALYRAARIRFRDLEVLTPGFRDTPWTQRAAFGSSSGEGGDITVAYLKERDLRRVRGHHRGDHAPPRPDHPLHL